MSTVPCPLSDAPNPLNYEPCTKITSKSSTTMLTKIMSTRTSFSSFRWDSLTTRVTFLPVGKSSEVQGTTSMWMMASLSMAAASSFPPRSVPRFSSDPRGPSRCHQVEGQSSANSLLARRSITKLKNTLLVASSARTLYRHIPVSQSSPSHVRRAHSSRLPLISHIMETSLSHGS